MSATVVGLDRDEFQRRLPELVDVYLAAYRGLERYAYTGRGRVAAYLHWLWRGDPGGLFVALHDGRAVGFAACHGRWDEQAGVPVAELHELAVAPSAQGRGVGSALLRAALAHGREQGALEIGLAVGRDNLRARRFYERHGFVYGEQQGEWLRMRRALAGHE